LVLLARRGLDRRDDLAGDAQLGEGPEAGLVLGAEVAGGRVQADQRLLLDVVGVAADEEVATALGPGDPPVAVDQGLEGLAIALLGAGGQFVVGDFGPVPEPGDPILCAVSSVCSVVRRRVPPE